VCDNYDDLIEQLQSNIPESWGASEGSAESICIDYMREIERRLIDLGGSLERWPEDEDGAPLPTGVPIPDRALRDKLSAIAAEYQRAPRWIRTQEVGKMLDDWLMG
jgi:hypothetical protein